MVSAIDGIKYTYSVILLCISIVLIVGLIFSRQTNLSSQAGPWAALALLLGSVGWLTMVEGGQGSLVGLVPVDMDLYKDTHKLTYKSTEITNKGDNLDRYLMGRQFMVVLMVFCVNLSGNPIGGAQLWGLPSWFINIFLGVGVAMVLFTCMVGQLASQVNGCHCMLDYVNNYFAVFTLYVAMIIEFSGLLHASYVVQMLVGAIAGQKIVSKEEPRNAAQNLFFFARCALSLAILAFALTVTLKGLFDGNTSMWKGVPAWASVVLFFSLMSIVGLLEGMQIAFFAVAKVTKEERGSAKFAQMTCDLLFKGKGRNLPGFMIGRQLCVVFCMFVVARVTSLNIVPGQGNNIYGVSDGFQAFLNLGFMGALITTILGSISWQLVASAFPLGFLSNPLVYVFLRICLGLEATGLLNGAWVLAAIQAKAAGFQHDEVYIGTAEDRAEKQKGDGESDVGPGHPRKLPAFCDNAPAELKELMESHAEVAKYIESVHDNAADVEAN
jgi:silicon transporter